MNRLYPLLTKLAVIIVLAFNTTSALAQCAVNDNPTNDCTTDFIKAFSLAGVASTGNTGCGSSGYNSFATPVRNLTQGQTYPWTASADSIEAIAIWIDLNNNGTYESSEMLVNSAGATGHSGNLSIPLTALAASNVPMRVRCASVATVGANIWTGSMACQDNVGGFGETEDYLVNIVCATLAQPTVGPGDTLCEGEITTLTASTGLGTLQWYSAPVGDTVVFTGSPFTTSFLGSDTTFYVAAETPGCSSTRASVSVDVNLLPVNDLNTSPSITCDTSALLDAGVAGLTYLWNTGETTQTIIADTSGAYSLTVTSPEGCVNADTLLVFIAPPSNGGTVTTLPELCINTSALLTLTGYVGDISWEANLGGGFSPIGVGDSLLTSPISQFGVFQVRAAVVSGVCPVSYSNVFAINVNTPAVSGTPTVNVSSVCIGAPSPVLSTTGSNGFITWEASINGGPYAAYGTGNPFLPGSPQSGDGGSYNVRLVAIVAGCPYDTAGPVTFTIDDFSDAGLISASDSVVCQGSDVNLTTNSGASSLTWQQSFNNGAFTTIANDDSIDVTNLNAGTYSFRTISASGLCPADTSLAFTVQVDAISNPGVFSIPTTICVGQNLTFTTTNEVGNIVWEGDLGGTGNYSVFGQGNPFNPGPPSSNDTAMYVFRIAATNGVCPTVNSSTDTVYIRALPVVDAGADITACGQSTVEAIASGVTYLWSNGQTSSSVNVTSSGTLTVTVTDQYGCSASDNNAVTINPLPVVNLGADLNLCNVGTTLDAGNAGAQFVWSDNSTAQTLDVNTSGSYSVTVVDNNGCMNSDAINVAIFNSTSVNIGPDITQCGGSVNLNAGNPGMIYIWSNNATSQVNVITTSGTYSVTVTNIANCQAIDTAVITINPIPNVGLTLPSAFDVVCTDAGALPLSGGLPAGGVFLGSGVSGNNFSSLGLAEGVYTINYAYVDNNGCTDTASDNVTIDLCDGINSLDANNVLVYPNPANKLVNISMDNVNGEVTIQIIDLQGRLVLGKLTAAAGTLFETINVSDLPVGAYFVKISNGNKGGNYKLVIQ